jgi:hypothetical protein
MDNMMMSLIDSIDVSSMIGTLNKISQVQAVVQSQLKPGHDHDVIPGTNKPTLLKPGAEKILMMFGLTSEYEIIDRIEDYDKGIFAYTIRCILSKNRSKITEGVGSCNSKENKYRWRWVKEGDLPTGIDINSLKQRTNKWNKTEYQVENDEIYSQANTILKMAKKRAQIDATLTVASLSEVFTQDIEDMKEFFQQENIDTMTDVESKNIKLTFGKHKGKTVGEIFDEAPDYIDWLINNTKDEVIRKACEMVISSSTKTNNLVNAAKETLYKHHPERIPDETQEDLLPWDDEGMPF